jgi:hypothetical protein
MCKIVFLLFPAFFPTLPLYDVPILIRFPPFLPTFLCMSSLSKSVLVWLRVVFLKPFFSKRPQFLILNPRVFAFFLPCDDDDDARFLGFVFDVFNEKQFLKF